MRENFGKQVKSCLYLDPVEAFYLRAKGSLEIEEIEVDKDQLTLYCWLKKRNFWVRVEDDTFTLFNSQKDF